MPSLPFRWARQASATMPGIAVGLLLSLSPGAQAHTLSQRIYTIFNHEYRAQTAFSPARLQAGVAATQAALSAPGSAIDPVFKTSPSAATALIDELQFEYDAGGARSLFKPALTAFTALAKLPLTRAQHRQALADEVYVRRVLAIDTAADLANWQAQGFAPTAEPRDTRLFGGIVAIHVPAIDIPVSGTYAQLRSLERLENRASGRIASALNALSSDWTTWSAPFESDAG